MAFSVLLVDDDPAFLALATQIVEDLGAEVVATAARPAEAVAAANGTRPDAALVDVGMPDAAGVDLAYELAALPWRPRVVLTSTNPDAVGALDPPDGRHGLPFIPKEDLAGARLQRLLIAD